MGVLVFLCVFCFASSFFFLFLYFPFFFFIVLLFSPLFFLCVFFGPPWGPEWVFRTFVFWCPGFVRAVVSWSSARSKTVGDTADCKTCRQLLAPRPEIGLGSLMFELQHK